MMIVLLVAMMAVAGCGDKEAETGNRKSGAASESKSMTQKEEYECLMRQFIDINRRKGVPSFGIKEAQEAIDVTVEYSPVKISRTKLLRGMIKELGENPNPYAYREKNRDQEQQNTHRGEGQNVKTKRNDGAQSAQTAVNGEKLATSENACDVFSRYVKSRCISWTLGDQVRARFYELSEDEKIQVARKLQELMND